MLSLLHNCKYRVGALINNAGNAIPGSVEDLSPQDFREHFKINVFGLLESTNAVVSTFRKQVWGRIVNISFIYSVVTAPNVGVLRI